MRFLRTENLHIINRVKLGDATLSDDHLGLYTVCSILMSCLMYDLKTEADLYTQLTNYSQEYFFFKPVWAQLSALTLDEGNGASLFAVVDFELAEDFRFRIIAIRGSVTEEDWKNNFDFADGNFHSFQHLHRGFCLRASDLPIPFLAEFCGEEGTIYNPPPPTVIFTGHSLGGAVATIAALPLLRNREKYKNVYVISFGAPTVASVDATWIDGADYKSHIFRFYFPDDAVPSGVRRVLGDNYRDFETLVEIDETNHSFTSVDLMPSCSTITPTDMVKFHRYQRYLNAFKMKDSHNQMNLQTNFNKPSFRSPARTIIGFPPDSRNKHRFQPYEIELIRTEINSTESGPVIVINGSGFNAAPVRAAIDFTRDADSEIEARNASKVNHDLVAFMDEVTIKDKAGNEKKKTVYRSKVYFECQFDATGLDIALKGTTETVKLNFYLTNGFKQSEKFTFPLKPKYNIAFMGGVGSGKSHLIDALMCHYQGKKYTGFQKGWGQDDNKVAHNFLRDDKFYYELPGLASADEKFLKEVDARFLEFIPKVIVFVHKADQNYAVSGLPKVIKELKSAYEQQQHSYFAKDQVKHTEFHNAVGMILVITCSHLMPDWLDPQQLRQELGLHDTVPIYEVNSVEHRLPSPDDKNKHIVYKAKGIPELCLAIEQRLKIPTLLGPQEMRGWWHTFINAIRRAFNLLFKYFGF